MISDRFTIPSDDQVKNAKRYTNVTVTVISQYSDGKNSRSYPLLPGTRRVSEFEFASTQANLSHSSMPLWRNIRIFFNQRFAKILPATPIILIPKDP